MSQRPSHRVRHFITDKVTKSCHQYEISGVLHYVWGSPHSGEMFEEEPLDEAPIYRGLSISYTRYNSPWSG